MYQIAYISHSLLYQEKNRENVVDNFEFWKRGGGVRSMESNVQQSFKSSTFSLHLKWFIELLMSNYAWATRLAAWSKYLEICTSLLDQEENRENWISVNLKLYICDCSGVEWQFLVPTWKFIFFVIRHTSVSSTYPMSDVRRSFTTQRLIFEHQKSN